MTLTDAQYGNFLSDAYVNTNNVAGLINFINKSQEDREVEIREWALAKKSSLQEQKVALASNRNTLDAQIDSQIVEIDNIINS